MRIGRRLRSCNNRDTLRRYFVMEEFDLSDDDTDELLEEVLDENCVAYELCR